MIEPSVRPESARVVVTSRIMHAGGAAAGGDWCEAFAVGDDLLALSIGDVCGHGEAKHPLMAAVRRTVRAAAGDGLDPAQTLAAANALCAGESGDLATAVFGLLSARRRTFTFANAGHPAPLLAGTQGAVYLEFPDADLMLGVEREFSPQLHCVDIPPASLLVLYTDGVTEHQRDLLRGEEELRAATLCAYNFSSLPAADVIEKEMSLSGRNIDDAAILSVWSAPDADARYRFRGRPPARSARRQAFFSMRAATG